MKEIKDSPKNKLEMFGFLNALLVQFSKLHGFTFSISHHYGELSDFISIGLHLKH